MTYRRWIASLLAGTLLIALLAACSAPEPPITAEVQTVAAAESLNTELVGTWELVDSTRLEAYNLLYDTYQLYFFADGTVVRGTIRDGTGTQFAGTYRFIDADHVLIDFSPALSQSNVWRVSFVNDQLIADYVALPEQDTFQRVNTNQATQ